MISLKPCPFCGSDKVESDISNGAIYCKGEGCSNLDVEAAWNKRPREEKLKEENARLREALEHYANRMGMGGTARRALEGSEE